MAGGVAARAGLNQEQSGLRLHTVMFGYLYSMLASTVILGRPVLGGALYMVGRVAALFSRLAMRGDFRRLPARMRRSGLALGAVSAALALGVLLVYPLAVDLPRLWLVFALSFLVLLMSESVWRTDGAWRRRGLGRVRRVVRAAEAMLLFCGAAALVLFFTMPSPASAWHLLGGFALCCLLETLALAARGEEEAPAPEAAPSGELPAQLDRLTRVNAYKTFRTVMMLTVTALQVTLILIYTFIGASSQSLLYSLAIAFLCTVLAQWVTAMMLDKSRLRPEPATALIVGLAMWLISLAAFALRSVATGPAWNYLSLAFCTSGVTMAAHSLSSLDRDMRDIVRFATGEEPGSALRRAHAAQQEYAALVGGMIALVGLALFTLISGGSVSRGGINLTAQPLLLLPALALVVAAIPAAFRVPMERKVAEKIRTFLRLKDSGEINLPLQRQLEDTVVKVHRRRYGIKWVILILRPLFYSKVVNKEKVKLDVDISCVFTCNHGELWGPVVTNLFVPFSFRPWVIDEIAEPDAQNVYLYENTVKRQAWLPERLKWPATRLVSAFLKWVMRSLDSIPVYRDDPRALVRTFRLTAEAMEAGDNILIFPENPNHESLEQAGYVKEGIGAFFTGFVMVAQLYHQRTGKRAQFIPIYADKKQHTLTFGEATRYNPDAPPQEEKERVARHLRLEMLRMAGESEAEGGDA